MRLPLLFSLLVFVTALQNVIYFPPRKTTKMTSTNRYSLTKSTSPYSGNFESILLAGDLALAGVFPDTVITSIGVKISDLSCNVKTYQLLSSNISDAFPSTSMSRNFQYLTYKSTAATAFGYTSLALVTTTQTFAIGWVDQALTKSFTFQTGMDLALKINFSTSAACNGAYLTSYSAPNEQLSGTTVSTNGPRNAYPSLKFQAVTADSRIQPIALGSWQHWSNPIGVSAAVVSTSSKCSGLVDNTKGTIEISQSKYVDNMDCSWILTTTLGRPIRVYFSRFSVEYDGSIFGCSGCCDRVNLGTSYTGLCGESYSQTESYAGTGKVYSVNNGTTLRFITDAGNYGCSGSVCTGWTLNYVPGDEFLWKYYSFTLASDFSNFTVMVRNISGNVYGAVRYEALPAWTDSLEDFDQTSPQSPSLSTPLATPEANITFQNPQAGTYYVGLYGNTRGWKANFSVIVPPPTITKIDPLTWDGTVSTMTITGYNFGASGSVQIGSFPCPVSSGGWTARQISCVIPNGQGENLFVTVNPVGLASVVGHDKFNYGAPKIAQGWVPTPLPSTNGEPAFQINGQNFGLTPTVTTGSGPCNVTNVTPTQITCSLPAGQGANVPITVTVLARSSQSIFSYAAPTVVSSSLNNSEVSIMGSNFGTSSAYITVTVGGLPCTSPVLVNPSFIRCTAPDTGSGDDQPVNVTVAGQWGRSPAGAGVYYPNARLDRISPTSGDTAGGYDLNLYGTVFTGVSSVAFGSISRPVLQSNSSWIRITVPAGEGTVSVRLQTGLPQTFTYHAPSITSVQPLNGTTRGNSEITIKGSNFGSRQAFPPSITLGNSACGLKTFTDATITCLIPEGSGAKVITVTQGSQQVQFPGFVYLPPMIRTVTPSVGNASISITLYGDNFGTDTAQIKIGSKDCIRYSNNHTVIVCQPPIGAGSQVVKVTVAGQTGGGGQTCWSTNTSIITDSQCASLLCADPNCQWLTDPVFNYSAPVITTITPAGPTEGNSHVTIRGSNFYTTGVVTFGTSVCSHTCPIYCNWNPEIIVCLLPSGIGTVSVVVSAEFNSSAVPYTYAPPNIISVSPLNGPTSGNYPIVIDGSSFGPISASVMVGTASCTPQAWSHNYIQCVAPQGQGKSKNVTVTVSGKSTSFKNNFFNYDPPLISSVIAPALPTTGGDVTLIGSNFGSPATGGATITASSADLGAIDCTVTGSPTDSQVSCALGPGQGVAILTLDVSSQTATTQVTYAAPVLSELIYSASGGLLTIIGENFGITPTVDLNGLDCPFDADSPKSHNYVVCVPPPGSGIVPVILTVGGQSSGALAFDYGIPLIELVEPASGPTTGNINLTITGANFGQTGAILVAGVTCPLLNRTAATIICLLPPGTGVTSVQLIGTTVGSSNAYPFRYYAPQLDQISPQSGSTRGNITLSLTGSNFGPSGVAGGSVWVGSSLCRVLSWNYTSISCTLPPGSTASLVNVTVAVTGQISNPQTFQYNAPTILNVNPNNGPTTGGTLIAIQGTSFGDFGTVKIDGQLCPTVSQGTSYSHELIKCTTPQWAGANLSVQVIASNTLTNTPSSVAQFSYFPPEIIQSTVFPTSSPTLGGGTLHLEGSNFGLTGTVTIGGKTCTNIPDYYSDTSIDCIIPAGQGSNAPIVLVVAGQSSNMIPWGYDSPTITSLALSAPTSGGVVTMTGTNFGPDQIAIMLNLGTVSIFTINELDDSSISFTIPSGTGAEKDISITVGGQSFTAPGIFSYDSPIVSTLSSSACSIQGNSVVDCALEGGVLTINGDNFGASTSVLSVSVGGVNCPLAGVGLTNPHHQITCTFPTTSAGGAQLSVMVTVDGQSGSLSGFSYTMPQINGDLTCASGNCTEENGNVIISLNSNAVAAEISFSISNVPETVTPDLENVVAKYGTPGQQFNLREFPCPIKQVTDTGPSYSIRCSIGGVGGVIGTGAGLTLQVQIDGFVSKESETTISFPTPFILPNTLRFPLLAPYQSEVVVSSLGEIVFFDVNYLGTELTPIRITYHLSSVSGNTATDARCQSITVIPSASDPRTVSCELPSGSDGPYNFQIRALNIDSLSGTDRFIYTPSPSIDSVAGCTGSNPTVNCPTSGNIPITLTGTNFPVGYITVRIGNQECIDPKLASPTTITCTLPPGTGQDLPIVVIGGSQFSIPKTLLSYAAPQLNTVTGCQSLTGSTSVSGCNYSGGDVLVLDGTNFGASNAQVFVGGSPCNVTQSSHTKITCTTPGGIGIDLPVFVIQASGVSSNVLQLSYKLCPRGSRIDQFGDSCTTCDAGSYSAQLGSAFCTPCPSGFYSSQGATACTSCPSGFYSAQNSSGNGWAFCTPCKPGSFTPQSGAISCQPCPLGKFNNDSQSQTACYQCDAGRFSDSAGSTVCTQCYPGSFSASPGASFCPLCRAGLIADSAGLTACTSCTAGYYSPTAGSSVCSGCEPGFYGTAVGSVNCLACSSGRFSNQTALTVCDRCQAGFFSEKLPSQGASACTPCHPGLYASQSDSGNCQQCQPGTYSQVGFTQCLACEPGRASQQPGAAFCSFCPDGYSSNSSAVQCTACPAGTAWHNDYTCVPCSPGYYARLSGSVKCTLCPPGSAGPQAGMVECITCTSGTYATEPGSTSCSACSPGTFSQRLQSGPSSCTNCSSGYFTKSSGQSRCSGCSAGYYRDANQSLDCLPCPRGTYSSAAASSCTSCDPGFFSSINGSVTCTPCATGYFTSEPNSEVCTACPAGKSQGFEGQTDCGECDFGQYISTTGEANCLPCPRGTFSNTQNATSCTNCLPGSIADSTGQSVCAQCSAGFYTAFDKSNQCYKCAPGTFSNSSGASGCTKCAAGFYAVYSGSTSCVACPAGQYSDQDGSVQCADCSQGKANNVTGQSHCAQCEAGYYQPLSGQARCVSCSPGTFASLPGGVGCLTCPPGLYSSQTGPRTCVACGPGSNSYSSGASSCTECQPGKYAPFYGHSVCLSCEVGRFSNVTNATTCDPCPPGTTNKYPGDVQCYACEVGYFSRSEAQSLCTPCDRGLFGNTTGLRDCFSCPQGRYGPQLGATNCFDCTPGTYQSVEGQDACIPCPQGTFGTEMNATSCLPCGPGTANQNRGSTECSDCAAGFYAAGNGSIKCLECPLGKFNDAGTQSICQSCGNGTYQDSLGQTFCISCGLGTYAPSIGSIECLNCPAGKKSDSMGLAECIDCDAGTESLPGAIICTECILGKVARYPGSRCTDCPAGTSSDDGISCISCDLGQYQDTAGSSSCMNCTAGFFAAELRSTMCKTCPAGSFQPDEGQSGCIDCPIGSYRSAENSSIACVECPAGKFQNERGSTTCFDCPIGEYSGANATQCIPCDFGTYQKDPGQAQCIPCPPGSYANEQGRSDCLQCSAGRYQSDLGKSTCLPCNATQYQDKEGQSTCELCDVGTYNKQTQQIKCVPCEKGLYQNQKGMDSCVPCEIGKAQDQEGQSSCVACSPGFYQSATQQVACNPCDSGSYQPNFNASECIPCELGRAQNNSGATSCVSCQPGEAQGNSGQKLCLICAPGKFSNTSQASSCTDCAAGTYQNDTRASTCIQCLPGSSSSAGQAFCLKCKDSGTKTVAPLPGMPSCITCGSGSEPNDGGTDCICPINSYAYSETSAISVVCKECPRGADCTSRGSSYLALGTLEGYWRQPNASEPIYYQCLQKSHCLGGINDYNQCAANREGPLCAFCAKGYRTTTGIGGCTACPKTGSSWGYIVFIMILIVSALVIMYYIILRNDQQLAEESRATELYETSTNNSIRKLKKSYSRRYRKINEMGEVTTKPTFAYKMKIVLSFLQIITNFPFSLSVPWPTYYQRFISALNIVNFDFLQWASVGCVVHNDFYLKWTVLVTLPIMLGLLLFTFYWLPLRLLDYWDVSDDNSQRTKRAANRRKFVKLVIFTIFLIYPPVSSAVLKLFICEKIANEYFLVADFTLHCYDHRWKLYAFSNILVIFIYPIGIPVLFGYLLWRNRHNLHHPSVRLQYGFLYDAYTTKMWWFELADMAHKLFLTSILAFFPQSAQPPVAMVWSTIYTVLILITQPYLRKGDDRLHLVGQTEMLLLILMGYVLTNPVRVMSRSIDIVLSLICIGVTIVFLYYFLLQATFVIRKMIYRRAMRRLKLIQDRIESEDDLTDGSRSNNDSKYSDADGPQIDESKTTASRDQA